MIQIREGQTGLHTIKNPGQAVFLIIILLMVIVGIALGIGWLSKTV